MDMAICSLYKQKLKRLLKQVVQLVKHKPVCILKSCRYKIKITLLVTSIC